MAAFFSETVSELKKKIVEEKACTLLLLNGDLGVGKTTLTQELFEALGADASEVTSPTFLKMLEHELPDLGLALHIDAYRMDEVEDLERLSLEAYEELRLIVVEWPRLMEEFLASRPDLKAILNISQELRLNLSMDEKGERSVEKTSP